VEAVHSIEADLLDRLQAMERDASRALSFVYTLGAFNHLVGSDPELMNRINGHGLFWVNTMAAVQEAGFTALGRLYDSGGNVHHIDGLLHAAELARGVFRRQVLLTRKLAAGVEPSVARDFVAGATVPGPAEFDRIRREFTNHRRLHMSRVQPIRNKVFAHHDRALHAGLETLFADLPQRVLEAVSLFPLRLHRALFKTYHDGQPLVLEDPPSNVVEIVKMGPLPVGENTWEHLHTVDAAVTFLQTIRSDIDGADTSDK
jgi:hypothetical protein